MNNGVSLQRNEKLKEVRLQHGWSQQEVADRLETTVVTVNRWERGIQRPSAYFRLKLCTLFEKSEAELGLLPNVTEQAPFLLENVDEGAAIKEGQTLVDYVPESQPPIVDERAAIKEGQTFVDYVPESQPLLVDRSSVSSSEPNLSPLKQRRRAFLKWGGIGLASALVASSAGIYWFSRSFSPLVYTYHTPSGVGVYDVEWSPRGDFLACVNGNETVQTFTVLSDVYHPSLTNHAVNCLSWSPDGAQIASPSRDQTMHIWDPINGVDALHIAYPPYPSFIPECIAWSPDGKQIALCGTKGMMCLWDARTGDLLLNYHGHSGTVWWVDWSPDSTRLASAGSDGTVRVWNARTGETLLTYHGQRKAVMDVKWSPSSTKIASASEDKTVHIWDSTTGETRLIYRGHKASVQAAEWSHDERVIASCGVDTTIQLWDASTGKSLATYQDHTNTVWTLSWAPTGKYLASSCADGTLRVWQTNV